MISVTVTKWILKHRQIMLQLHSSRGMAIIKCACTSHVFAVTR
jgi:hypothetical protein